MVSPATSQVPSSHMWPVVAVWDGVGYRTFLSLEVPSDSADLSVCWHHLNNVISTLSAGGRLGRNLRSWEGVTVAVTHTQSACSGWGTPARKRAAPGPARPHLLRWWKAQLANVRSHAAVRVCGRAHVSPDVSEPKTVDLRLGPGVRQTWSSPASAAGCLCDLGQLNQTLWVRVSHGKGG